MPAKKLYTLIAIFFLASGCLPSSDTFEVTYREDEELAENVEKTKLFEASYQAMTSCFSCHSAGYQYGDFQNLRSDEDWIEAGLVVPGKPDESLLVRKLIHSKTAISNMPPTGDLAYEKYQVIRQWIVNMPKKEKASGKILGLSLMNASLGSFVSVLQDGEEVNLDSFPRGMNIKAEVEGDVDYVTFKSPMSLTDNSAPFYACGQSGDSLNDCGFKEGAYEVIAFAYKNSVEIDSITVSITFTKNAGMPTNPTNPTPPPRGSYFEQSYQKMGTCFHCHNSSSQYGNLQDLKSEEDWINKGLVKPGKPDDSLLVRKLRHSNSAIATMPPANDFSKEDYEYIREWISQIKSEPETPNPPPVSSEDKFTVKAHVIGIEQFLAQMKKLYFIKGEDNKVFYGLANNWREFWGGGCDFYQSAVERLKTSHQLVWEKPSRVCAYDSVQNGPQGRLSIIKAGSRINICEYFADSDKHMNEFYSKNIISGNDFNKANAQKVFELYYPTLSFTDEIYNNFVTQAKSSHSAIAGDHDLFWRLYLSTLCQSLAWETF